MAHVLFMMDNSCIYITRICNTDLSPQGKNSYANASQCCFKPHCLSVSFRNYTFCTLIAFMCFCMGLGTTHIISLYSIKWPVSVKQKENVYCAVRTETLTTILVNFSLLWVKRSAKKSRNSPIPKLMTCDAAPVSSCLVRRHTSIQQYMFRRSLSETFVDIVPDFASHRFIMRQLTANRKPSYHSHFMYLGNLLLNGALSVVWQRRIGKPTFKMSLLLIQS